MPIDDRAKLDIKSPNTIKLFSKSATRRVINKERERERQHDKENKRNCWIPAEDRLQERSSNASLTHATEERNFYANVAQS